MLGTIFGLHILVFWQISFGDHNRRSGKTPEAPAMISWFVSPERDATPAAKQSRLKPQAPPVDAIPREPASIDEAITQPLETESAAAVDWSAEANRVASDAIHREQAQKNLRQFGQIPRGIGPPPPRPARHQRGDSQHFDGGEIVDWTNDHCYYSNDNAPIAAFGPALRLKLPTCKGASGEPLPSIEDWKKERDDR